jgi:negative regulator of flagellin synthesis FlgM
MKIGPLEPKPQVAPATGERKASATPAKAGTAGAAEASAQVELSSTASTLATGSTDGSFDAEKVQRVSQAIRDGKFQVNPEVIADKLIANAQELLGKTSR